MKKILLAVTAALAITSCSQNEEFDNAGQQREISFTPVVGKATRVAPLVKGDFKAFTVYGYNVGTTDFDGTGNLPAELFGPAAYSKPASDWTGDTFYWPASLDERLCFFAYSPASVTGYAATTSFPSFGYEVRAVASQEDLVVASALNKTRTSTGVDLVFNHILTQLNFSASLTPDFTYTIENISINNVANKGTFTYSKTIGDWKDQEGTASYSYDGNFSATVANNILDLSKADNALMLMPQTLPANAEISITYKVVSNTTSQTTFDGVKKVTISGTWNKGSNIRYKLVLPTGAQAITYAPDVNDWTDEEKTETVQ